MPPINRKLEERKTRKKPKRKKKKESLPREPLEKYQDKSEVTNVFFLKMMFTML